MRKCRFVSNNSNRGIPGDNEPETEFYFHGFGFQNEETVALIEDPTGRVFEVKAERVNFVSPPVEPLEIRGENLEFNPLKMSLFTRREKLVEENFSLEARQRWKEKNFGYNYGGFSESFGAEMDRQAMGALLNTEPTRKQIAPDDILQAAEKLGAVAFDFNQMEKDVLLQEAGRRFFTHFLPWLDMERQKFDFDELPFFKLYMPRPGQFRVSHEMTDRVLEIIWAMPPVETNGDFIADTESRGYSPGELGYSLGANSGRMTSGENSGTGQQIERNPEADAAFRNLKPGVFENYFSQAQTPPGYYGSEDRADDGRSLHPATGKPMGTIADPVPDAYSEIGRQYDQPGDQAAENALNSIPLGYNEKHPEGTGEGGHE